MERVVPNAFARTRHRLPQLFCEVLQRSLDCDFLGITTGDRDFYFVFASLSAASPQSNLRVFQVFGGKSVSEEHLFGQRHLVGLDRYHQLVVIVFVGLNHVPELQWPFSAALYRHRYSVAPSGDRNDHEQEWRENERWSDAEQIHTDMITIHFLKLPSIGETQKAELQNKPRHSLENLSRIPFHFRVHFNPFLPLYH